MESAYERYLPLGPSRKITDTLSEGLYLDRDTGEKVWLKESSNVTLMTVEDMTNQTLARMRKALGYDT